LQKINLVLIVLVLGFVLPAWSSPGTLPEPASPEPAASEINETRQKPRVPPAAQRGQLLYENHCMSCHESVVHIRSTKHTRSIQELQARVRLWAENLKLRWGKEEVDDVVKYLDTQYYKFGAR
jgi:mono/diheme cytochrome c family protein